MSRRTFVALQANFTVKICNTVPLTNIELRILTGGAISPNDEFIGRRLVAVIDSTVLASLASRYLSVLFKAI